MGAESLTREMAVNRKCAERITVLVHRASSHIVLAFLFGDPPPTDHTQKNVFRIRWHDAPKGFGPPFPR